VTTAKQDARTNVRTAPHESDNTHYRKRGGGYPGRKPDGRAIRSKQNDQRSGRQQQQRGAHEHREGAPERTEDGEEIDVPLHDRQRNLPIYQLRDCQIQVGDSQIRRFVNCAVVHGRTD
jgi:hypothetical protein